MSFYLRTITKLNRLSHFQKNYSTNSKLISVIKNDNTDTSIISMDRAPVNGLNLELLQELKNSLITAQNDGSKGVILTSSLPTIFSGGLDIGEMYKPDMKRAKQFWEELQQTWLTLYGLGIPTAAAVNGACPAGGCLLAMSCEYRVFVDGKHTMGLNETKLGIVAPTWFKDVYIATIGYRKAELALLQGTQFLPLEALKINLVDEVVSNKEDAILKCQNFIDSFAKIPATARRLTKLGIRDEIMKKLEENRESDVNTFLKYLEDPSVQKGLGLYIQSLKKKN